MDNGNKVSSSLKINTNSYTIKEIELFIKVLKDNFDLDSSIHLYSNNIQ